MHVPPSSRYPLFCMGHPLVDMQVRNGHTLLEKYGLKANDAIQANEKQVEIYDELVANYQVTYVAGGAAQNTARGAAYILPPESVVYIGAVGDDELSQQLKEANKREGLRHVYQVIKGEKTGACAVVITGHERSLVTTLHAAKYLEKSHLLSPEVAPLIDNAKFFYVEGYLLIHGLDAALELGTKAATSGKTFMLNISAPFIPRIYGDQLKRLLPYVDIIIGNEAEAESWASANDISDTMDLPTIARSIALFPKSNALKQRTVIFTQGAQNTVLMTADKPNELRIFPVNGSLKDHEIVDTNGAGDAFAGGFAAGLVSGKELDECVLTGHALARECVQQIGPQYPWPKVKILRN